MPHKIGLRWTDAVVVDLDSKLTCGVGESFRKSICPNANVRGYQLLRRHFHRGMVTRVSAVGSNGFFVNVMGPASSAPPFR